VRAIAGDHCFFQHLGSSAPRELEVAARVPAPAQYTVKLAQPESLVSGLARDPARARLALEGDYAADGTARTRARAGQPRGPASHDAERHRPRLAPVSNEASFAPQKTP